MKPEINPVGSTVSYGIGVQNRYSAFLENEDGFNPLASVIVAQPKSQPQKQRQTIGKPILSNKQTVISGKLDQKNSSSSDKRSLIRTNGNIQKQPVNSVTGLIGQKQQLVRNKHQATDNNLADTQTNRVVVRYTRNAATSQQPNSHLPTNHNREQEAKLSRESNQRLNRRSLENELRGNVAQTNGPELDGSKPSRPKLENEKNRHQQKRIHSLKHRDLGRRETRHQQNMTGLKQSTDSSANHQTNGLSHQQSASTKNKQNVSVFNKQSEREENSIRDSRSSKHVQATSRRLHVESNDTLNGREKHDLNSNRVPHNNVRTLVKSTRKAADYVTKKDGFKANLMREKAEQKPIPNFSDKLDFPTLS